MTHAHCWHKILDRVAGCCKADCSEVRVHDSEGPIEEKSHGGVRGGDAFVANRALFTTVAVEFAEKLLEAAITRKAALKEAETGQIVDPNTGRRFN